MTNQPDGDPASDDLLPPTEATDSDELRNDDGDEVVTAPDHWHAVDESLMSGGADGAKSLDDKLAAEESDTGTDPPQAIDDGGSDSFFSVEK